MGSIKGDIPSLEVQDLVLGFGKFVPGKRVHTLSPRP